MLSHISRAHKLVFHDPDRHFTVVCIHNTTLPFIFCFVVVSYQVFQMVSFYTISIMLSHECQFHFKHHDNNNNNNNNGDDADKSELECTLPVHISRFLSHATLRRPPIKVLRIDTMMTMRMMTMRMMMVITLAAYEASMEYICDIVDDVKYTVQNNLHDPAW